MPRVKPLTKSIKMDNDLLACLLAQMKLYGKTQKDLAEYIGMDPATISRRMHKPSSFTLEELRKLKTLFPEFVYA